LRRGSTRSTSSFLGCRDARPPWARCRSLS
jgi:hypothetical protein